MTDFASPIPVIRPALPSDKADVFEFTKFIWDGHDYVGYVFPRWLEDPNGQLFAVEYAGHCIGCAKVTLLAPGQWWLEGFRIDPNYQGLKIGSRLDAATNEWWDEHGDGTLRLLTNSKRVKVHHLSEARGFVRVGEVYAYAAEPLAEATDALIPVRLEEVEEAGAFCQRAAPNAVIDMGWRYVTPNMDSLCAAAEAGLAFWWRGRAGFVSAWDDDEDDGIRFTVGLAACAEAERVDLLMDIRRLASARQAVSARWMNVISEAALRDLEAAGYIKDWEDAAYLYERPHS